MDAITDLAAAMKRSKYTVVLTGAGASTDSGLPDFRSKEGLWQGVDPMKLASMTALRKNSVVFYQFYRHRLSKLQGARPNRVHELLADMQRAGVIHRLITQNIDGLHQAAGATDVVELHGSLRHCVCIDCRREYPSDLLDVDVETIHNLPRCPHCDGMLKPGVILFEEALPQAAIEAAIEATYRADLFIVIGSSLEVAPANQLPAAAVANGADLAIVTLGETHLDRRARWRFDSRAVDVLAAIWSTISAD